MAGNLTKQTCLTSKFVQKTIYYPYKHIETFWARIVLKSSFLREKNIKR